MPNTYSVKWFDNAVRHWPRELAHEVTFVDRSGRSPGIALPSPLLLRWHAALAHVFHHSGVLELFNALRGPPGGDAPVVPSKSGDAFMEYVVNYDGEAISRYAELTGAVSAMFL